MKSIRINKIEKITHDVNRYVVEKPEGYSFEPGQATEVAIDKPDWKEETRPFTFTSLPDDDFLEFTIKSYRDHDGVTNQLDQLNEGDHLLIDDAWGAITYKGPGWFIAGGAGVTPFISILKMLKKKDKLDDQHLMFSNKAADDIIMESTWKDWLGDRFISTLTRDEAPGNHFSKIDPSFLKAHINDFEVNFYVCGPQKMVKDVSSHLETLGANLEGIVFEE